MPKNGGGALLLASVSVLALMVANPAPAAAKVTYAPYIQPGDAGPLGEHGSDCGDVADQRKDAEPERLQGAVRRGGDFTLDQTANPAGRVVDNYLAADPSLPVPPTAYGAHTNYTTVLRDLRPNTLYSYRVIGPGLPGEWVRRAVPHAQDGR